MGQVYLDYILEHGDKVCKTLSIFDLLSFDNLLSVVSITDIDVCL